jgi:hypothetical protein
VHAELHNRKARVEVSGQPISGPGVRAGSGLLAPLLLAVVATSCCVLIAIACVGLVGAA